MKTVKRGEVHLVKPDPAAVGKEQQKQRPYGVVSNDVLNATAGLVVVCPITDAEGKKPDVIHILAKQREGGLVKESIILCEQMKAVDVERLIEKFGNLEAETMRKIDAGLRLVLNLQRS